MTGIILARLSATHSALPIRSRRVTFTSLFG